MNNSKRFEFFCALFLVMAFIVLIINIVIDSSSNVPYFALVLSSIYGVGSTILAKLESKE